MHQEIINELEKHHSGIVVYDIDGTLIDNSGYPKYDIIHTFKYTLKKGLIPVIITARPGHPENINYTKRQLAHFGIQNYLGIYFMPPHIAPYPENQAKYKLRARKDLHDKGYKILASIGDMPWDYGAYGGVGFRV